MVAYTGFVWAAMNLEEEHVLNPRMILSDDKHMYWNPEQDEDDKNDEDDINYFSPGYYPSR